MLGKLAKWLRIFGYDTVYNPYLTDGEILRIAKAEQRLILTRDTRLVLCRYAKPNLLVEHDLLPDQLRQVIRELDLQLKGKLFSRCLICNCLLQPINKELVRASVPAYVFATQSLFSRCPYCQRIFWPATHIDKMQAQIREILNYKEIGERGDRGRVHPDYS